MRTRLFLRGIIIYALCLILTWFLIEVIWGTTGGVLAGLIDSWDRTYQGKVQKILKDAGLSEKDFERNPDLHKLPVNVQKSLEDLTKSSLRQHINWFAVTFFVSALVFAIVGFIGAFLTRTVLFIGLIPALSFFVNNPLVRFDFARELSLTQKVVVVFAQFGFCYLLGYFGAALGKRRDEKKSTQRGNNELHIR